MGHEYDEDYNDWDSYDYSELLDGIDLTVDTSDLLKKWAEYAESTIEDSDDKYMSAISLQNDRFLETLSETPVQQLDYLLGMI